ncbi:MAG: competence/damage-inducible protein A [Planctomycetes bacterium]|nr:competence/damage-inducible protein A [Planctomycetota bacterium]
MNAQLLSIGNELTLGQTVDTNAAWLAQRLAAVGVLCTRHVTVADERAEITREILEAAKTADLLLVTGGLGPTPDDLTRETLADAMGVELVFHPECMTQIEAYFASRKRAMHPQNRQQAMCPRGATPLDNPHGTAPGVRGRLGNCDVYLMPGVPREMKPMFETHVLPNLSHGSGAAIVQRTIKTFGMPEAEVGEKIADLMARGRNPTVGTSAADLIISIRINAHGETVEKAVQLAEADARVVRERLGVAVFGEEGDSVQDAVARLLIEQGKTISTAESCTGGLISKRLTDVSGSSAYLVQAFVTYANSAKERLLEIPPALIAQHGAVSAPVAEAMAANCRRISGTDYALSATGVAGPTGGTREKPVGLVFVGLATAEKSVVKELRFGENLSRDEIRDRTAKAALNLLRLELIGRSS